MAKILSKSFEEIAQTLLDQEYGSGKAQACTNGMVKFCFPETHNGCNEIEVGTWKMTTRGKKPSINLYVYVEYVEALEHLKAGSRPKSGTLVDISQFFAAPPKGLA